jgi:hypothetical protein
MFLRIALLATVIALLPAAARAQQVCRFVEQAGGVWLLQNDCQTDHTIEIEDGIRLDGAQHVITAIDTSARPFRGAVILARGRSASVVNTQVSADLVSGVCLAGDALLRGILFDGASGEIIGNTVTGINRGAADCEEGNAIELRNRARQGPPLDVVIRKNRIDAYQKAAIVVNGNVEAIVEENAIGGSLGAPIIAPTGIQIGPQASAQVQNNHIAGRFNGRPQAGVAILLFQSGPGTIVDGNAIEGDSDEGIDVLADGATVINNVIRDSEPSGLSNYGIVNRGSGNVFINNTIIGFRTRTSGVDTAPPSRGLQIE